MHSKYVERYKKKKQLEEILCKLMEEPSPQLGGELDICGNPIEIAYAGSGQLEFIDIDR